MGYIWEEIVTMSQHRIKWRAFIDGQCTQRLDEKNGQWSSALHCLIPPVYRHALAPRQTLCHTLVTMPSSWAIYLNDNGSRSIQISVVKLGECFGNHASSPVKVEKKYDLSKRGRGWRKNRGINLSTQKSVPPGQSECAVIVGRVMYMACERYSAGWKTSNCNTSGNSRGSLNERCVWNSCNGKGVIRCTITSHHSYPIEMQAGKICWWLDYTTVCRYK